MAFEVFPSVGPYAPEDLTADLNTNFGKTAEVALSTLADGEFLVYDGSSSVWINRTSAEAGIPSVVADLTDVTIATVANGEFMIYDGSSSSWVNATAAEAGVPVNLEDLTNVSIATPADGETLVYDGSSGTWINTTTAASTTLADLTDTSIATPAEGEILTYDGSSGSWINATSAAAATTLADLTDTSIATPAEGEVLTYDGSSGAWINAVSTGTASFTESPSYRNKLINGNFAVNQRGVSGTVTLSAGEYGHDRWKGGASGATYTFATSANITTITITAGSLIQVIKGDGLQTGTHTLSWTGTAQGKIGAGSFSSTGVTGSATGGTNLNIEFNTGTVSLTQFEEGSTATPFEHMSYEEHLNRCLPYYFRLTGSALNKRAGAGFANTTAQFHIVTHFPVKMISTVTALETSGVAANYTVETSAGTTACTAVPTYRQGGDTSMGIRFTATGGASAAGDGVSVGVGLGGYLGFSAEL